MRFAACPRCDVPMILEDRRRRVRCTWCGKRTARRRLIALVGTPRRRRWKR